MMNGIKHHSGPDEVAAADSLTTCRRDGAVKLRLPNKLNKSEIPISVMTALKATVDRSPKHIALGHKVKDTWVTFTYKQYYDIVRQTARAFIKLGLKAYHGVGIIGFNSPEWFIADLAAIFAGGFAVGVYTTNSPEACHYVADNADCNILVVENDQQLQKILEVRDRLPHLKAIVQYKGQPKEKYSNVYSWHEMLDLGTNDLDDELETRIKNQAPNKCCTLIYTSGTTGSPKGVMLSHDNVVWTAKMVATAGRGEFNNETIVSYLPLSHVAAQLLDIYAPIVVGGSVYFAQPDALKGSLATTLKEIRPTAFLGVPRVWEKMQEAMVAVGKSNGTVTRNVALWAKGVGLKSNMSVMNGGSPSIMFGCANALVFKKVRKALGLDRCKLCISGAAPIMRDTLAFFMSLNLPIMEVYGMSESSGPQTFSVPWCYNVGSVGKEFPGAETMLADPDKEGNGEICMGGRHIFMGYLNMEEKMKEAVDENGWLRSGDVGKKDKKGFLYVTGRIKEILITAGGENVAPIPIEDRVKETLPCISNCMLIGDKCKFLCMLLTLKTEQDPDTTEPKDQLAPPALDWCKSVGSSSTKLSEILRRDVPVLQAIQRGIDLVNKKATSRAQVIQKWSVLPRDFTLYGGELGPTLKLKRNVVLKTYSQTIESFYTDRE